MMKPIRVTAPTVNPVTLPDVKGQARIFHADDDIELQAMVASAVSLLDGYGGILGRAIMAQKWMQPFAGWSGILRLPMPEVRDVEVKYTDQNGTEQTVSPSDYEVIEGHTGPVVHFLTTFSAPSLKTDILQPVRVTFTTGADQPHEVDARIKRAIAVMVTHWDEFRGVVDHSQVREVPMGVVSMLAPLRWRLTA